VLSDKRHVPFLVSTHRENANIIEKKENKERTQKRYNMDPYRNFIGL